MCYGFLKTPSYIYSALQNAVEIHLVKFCFYQVLVYIEEVLF